MKRYAVIITVIFALSLIPNTSIISQTYLESLDDSTNRAPSMGRSNNPPVITSFDLDTTGDLIVGQEELLEMSVEATDADDPSGESLEYSWAYQNGALSGCGGNASAGTTCQLSIISEYVMIFAVTVTVTDSEGASVSEEMLLEIWNDGVGAGTTVSGIQVQYSLQYWSPADFNITASDGDLNAFMDKELPGYIGTYDAIGVVEYAPENGLSANDILSQSMSVAYDEGLGATSLWYVTNAGLWTLMSATVEDVDASTSMFNFDFPADSATLPAGNLVLIGATLEATLMSRPTASAEIIMLPEYADQVELVGTKTVSSSEWDIYQITLDDDGETSIHFDVSNSTGQIETYQWKVLFDAPYGVDDFALEGHTFTESANNSSGWSYPFKNATVDPTGENENTIRLELVTIDNNGNISDKFRMFFVILPYESVDDEPDASISAFSAWAGQNGALVMNWNVSSILLSSEYGVITICAGIVNCAEPFTTVAMPGATTYTYSGTNTVHGEAYYVSVAICNVTGCSTPVGTGTIIAESGATNMPAPPLEGQVYAGENWTEYDFSKHYSTFWTPPFYLNQPWTLLQFTDTDCPYCFNSAQEFGEASEYFDPSNLTNGAAEVQFFASASELTGLNGHNSSREEIVAFRDKIPGEMCNSSNQDCSVRGGEAHNLITYIDDLDNDNRYEWGVTGTPAYFLIQPNGIIAWSSIDNPEEQFYNAINRLIVIFDQQPQNDGDGDGIPDYADLFPNDANETQDSDGDGVGDNADAFPNDGNETHDDDGDGLGNNFDAFPQDENETMDSDQDGVGDNEDPEPLNPDVSAPQDISVEISDTSSYLIAGSIMILALVILFVRRKQPPNTIAKSHFVEEESLWNDS